MRSDDRDDLTPHQSQRLRALARYLAALEQGDDETLAAMARLASDDPTLEWLILALHTVYGEVDATRPTNGEVAQAQALLGARFADLSDTMTRPKDAAEATTEAEAQPSLNGATPATQPIPLWRRMMGRPPRADADTIGDETIMSTREQPDDVTTPTALARAEHTSGATVGAPIPTPARPRPRPRRWLRVAQGLVAVLVVAALLGSFYTVFQRLRPQQTVPPLGTTTYTTTGKHQLLVGSWIGEVWLLDTTTGKPYWRFSMGDGHPVTALIVENGVVVVGDTYLGNVTVFAVRLSDGKLLWTQARRTDGFPNNVYADQNAVYLNDGTGTYALRITDGKQLWSLPNSQTIAAANGAVYVVGGLSQGDFTLMSVQSSDGKQLWSRRFSNLSFPAIARVVGQTVYVGNAAYSMETSSPYLALDAQTGKTIATLPPLPAGASTIQVTDTQFFLNASIFNQEKVCAYQFPTLVQSWCKSVDFYPSAFTTATQNGMFYAQDQIQVASSGANTTGVSGPPPPYRPAIVAFDGATGGARWQWTGPTLPALGFAPGGVSGAATLSLPKLVSANGAVYSGTNGGVFAVNAANGKLLWRFNPSDTFVILAAV